LQRRNKFFKNQRYFSELYGGILNNNSLSGTAEKETGYESGYDDV
jgi:hypothetical protein